jgi:MFS family permease
VVRILPFRDSHYDASTTSKNHLRSGESRRFRLAGHRAGVYGFSAYSLGAALVFHEIFFPEQSAAMALILAMGTYGAGYIARIVGALSSAEWATAWRKKVLFITITMMGICTTLIGVLPTYAQMDFCPCSAGHAAYYSGAGAGAKSPGRNHAGGAPKKRGIISSLVAMGTNCGTLSATAIWAVMFFALDVKSCSLGLARAVPRQRGGDDLSPSGCE